MQDVAEAKKIVKEKYSTVARQNLIRQELLSLHLSKIIDAESRTPNKALAKIRDNITTFAPQEPETQRSEEAKVEYLYNALIGVDWAKPALTNGYAQEPPWDLQQLYTALAAAYYQEQSRSAASKTASGTSSILWGLQGMYDRPRYIKNTFLKDQVPKTCATINVISVYTTAGNVQIKEI